MGIKGEMSGTVCVTFTWDMYIYNVWVVYSFCLFCCLFSIVIWWYVRWIVWASARVGVNSIPELELQLNSNSKSGIGIGIEIGGIENELKLKTLQLELKTGIEFLQLLLQHLLVNQQFPNFSFNRGHNLACDWLLIDLRSAQVYCVAIFLVSQEVSLNFHRCCG